MDLHSAIMLVGFGGLFALVWYLKRPDIRGRDARALVAGGARLVDVRTAAEFGRGHVDGARNIPVGELGRRVDELGERDRPIIVYCASGTRSAVAKRVLRRAGFTHVSNLGAMSNW